MIMNKRTAVLKEIANQHGVDVGAPIQKSSRPHEIPYTIQSSDTKTSSNALILDEELERAAQILKVSTHHLAQWLDHFDQTPASTKNALLRIICQQQLDPFLDEVVFTQYDDQQWEALITVSGWAKLMNRCPQFTGVQFTQSREDTEEAQQWMECTIYRSDRIVPISLREYLIEVKGDSPLWKKMPRRMLRHRVFSQCAKLALS
jgi:hypothetical protein